MDRQGLYEKVMAAAPAELRARPRVRASAGVVPWRTGPAGVEVFWVERSRDLPFMAGFFAFPGGGLKKTDAELVFRGQPKEVDDVPLDGAMPASVLSGVDLEPVLAPGVVGAALRELFEETGILPLTAGSKAISDSDRRRLLRGEVEFSALIGGGDRIVDASVLSYAGRWLTPPLGRMRFDNRFFLLEWPTDMPRQPEICGGELVLGEWIRPIDALERWSSGEVITAPPILHILEVLADEGPVRGVERLVRPVDKNLGPHRWIEFRPGVLLFPLRSPTLPPAGHTNAYVLGTRETVLVDPGSPFPDEIDGLIEALRALDQRGRSLRAIWLTHHHPDHVGGVEAVRTALDVPVCAHQSTAERLRERGIEVDDLLLEDQRVVLEGRPPFPVRVVHTPGHAQGHLAFLDETFGSFLVGDLVAGMGTIVIDPPEGDMEEYLGSLRKAAGFGATTLFPAHGPPTIRVEERFEEYIEHRRWRETRILAEWERGLRGRELLAAAYRDTPRQSWPLARRQLLAHLESLQKSRRLPSSAAAEFEES